MEKLSQNSLKVLKTRYFAKNENGEIIEDEKKFFERIAKAISSVDPDEDNRKNLYKEYFERMSTLKFLPNTPTLINAGRPLGQLSACFVLPVEDSMAGIFDSVKNAALIHQSGGGCISGNATILTESGPISLKELVDRGTPTKVLSYDPITRETRFALATHFHKTNLPPGRTYAIYFRGSKKTAPLYASDWHPFFIWDGKTIVEKRADNISSGDTIIGSTIFPEEKDLGLDSFWWSMGVLINHGTVHQIENKTKLSMHIADKSVFDNISSFFEIDRVENTEKYFEIYTTDKTTKDILSKFDDINFNLEYINRIPCSVWSTGPIQKLSLLVGLLDSSGYIDMKNKTFKYTTNNNCLANEIVSLCGWLGLSTTITKNKNLTKKDADIYIITIKSHEGFYSYVKKYSVKHKELSTKLYTKLYTKDSIECFVPLYTGNVTYKNMVSKNEAYLTLKATGEKLHANAIMSSHTVDKVESLNKSFTLYDLTVAGTQTYIAGMDGRFVVAHNTGFSFSRLRAEGSLVKTTGGKASGPVSFMQVFNASTDTVKAAGVRRGANMAVLRVDHPDIMSFIDCKQDLTKMTNFNISVGITEAFMEALESSSDYELIDPSSNKAIGKLSAQIVWNKICQNAWKTGEPGLFFIDRANKDNPTPSKWTYEATNPCSRGNSMVLTKKGLVEISSLSGKTEEIWNGKTWSKSFFWSNGVKPVYRLTLSDGRVYEGTIDHRLADINDKEVFIGKAISNNSIFKHFLGDGSWDGTNNISEKEAVIFGYMYGKAKEQTNKIEIAISPNDEEIRFLFTEYLQNKNVPFYSEAASKITIENDNKSVENILNMLFKEKNKNNGLPNSVFTFSPKLIKKFLKGLLSSYSYKIDNNKIVFSINSINYKQLTKEIQLILSSLGIKSNIQYASINIYGIYANIFVKEIGLLNNETNNKLIFNTSNEDINSQSVVYSLEYIGKEEVFDFNEPDTHWGWISGFKSHNCGEQILGPYENCTLASINLEKHIKDNSVDWEDLSRTIEAVTNFLDNVVDANKFPVEILNEINKGTRRIGLGIMGFSRMLMRLAIPYDSDEGLKIAGDIMSFIKETANKVSVYRGEKYGYYPYFEGIGVKRRNSHLLTIAPTGTISMIADTSSGCEPEFALIWYKNVLDGQHLPYMLPIFEEVAKKEGFWSDTLLEKILNNHGSCRGIKEVPKFWQAVFATAHDISPEWHVKMQAEFQKHIDAAVSKTINMPKNASIKDVDTAYKLAYKLGCKGITVYRDGSRENQVLNTGVSSVKKDNQEDSKKLNWGDRIKYPGALSGIRVPIKGKSGKAYMHAYYNNEGKLVEIFITPSTEHQEKEMAVLFGRLGSLALQYGAPLKAVVTQLVKSHEEAGLFGSDIQAIAKALSQIDKEYKKIMNNKNIIENKNNDDNELQDNTSDIDTIMVGLCPNCKNKLVFQEGCLKCVVCKEYSKCG